jgi:hypothetical protein
MRRFPGGGSRAVAKSWHEEREQDGQTGGRADQREHELAAW